MPRSGPPIALGLLCCVVAPVLGLLAASLVENPPGNGPGALQVVLGAGVPTVLSFGAASLAGARPPAAVLWALASLLATGALLFALFLFVEVVIQPA
jgi:hypothetical protein